MEFYLTSKRTGARLRIPLLPDRLNVKTGASVVSLSIIKKGEVKIPVGQHSRGILGMVYSRQTNWLPLRMSKTGRNRRKSSNCLKSGRKTAIPSH